MGLQEETDDLISRLRKLDDRLTIGDAVELISRLSRAISHHDLLIAKLYAAGNDLLSISKTESEERRHIRDKWNDVASEVPDRLRIAEHQEE